MLSSCIHILDNYLSPHALHSETTADVQGLYARDKRQAREFENKDLGNFNER